MSQSNETAANMAKLMWLIPKLYHRLSALSEGIYAKHSLNSGKRSILEELDRSGPRTIAEMVQTRAPVTRQYVQRLVSELVDSGFVSLSKNEQDHRSKIVDLTTKGNTLLATIRPEENMLVRELADGYKGPEIVDALETLQSISTRLQPVETIVEPVKGP